MPNPIVVSQTNYTQVPAGTCAARLQEITDLGMQDKGFGAKHYLSLRFVTSHADPQTGDPLTIERLCTSSLNSQSALRPIVEALLNGAPIPQRLDLNDLLGLPCQLVVTLKAGKDGRQWARISAVLPPVAQTSAPAAPQPAAPRYAPPAAPQPAMAARAPF